MFDHDDSVNNREAGGRLETSYQTTSRIWQEKFKEVDLHILIDFLTLQVNLEYSCWNEWTISQFPFIRLLARLHKISHSLNLQSPFPFCVESKASPILSFKISLHAWNLDKEANCLCKSCLPSFKWETKLFIRVYQSFGPSFKAFVNQSQYILQEYGFPGGMWRGPFPHDLISNIAR